MKCEGWAELPIIPLQKILVHLKLEDVLSATSTCKHWRSVLQYYNGERDRLKLSVGNLEKSMFLTHMFRRCAYKIHIELTENEVEINAFLDRVLPKFFNMGPISELVFMGHNQNMLRQKEQIINIKSDAANKLININAQYMDRLIFLGCQALFAGHDEDYDHEEKTVDVSEPIEDEFPILLDEIPFKPDSYYNDLILGLRHICIDYESVNMHFILCLGMMPGLTRLTINLVNRNKNYTYETLPWAQLYTYHSRKVHISLNIIGVSYDGLTNLMETVLVPEMPLNSLKLLFCKTIHCPLIKHIGETYPNSLVEFQWVDSHVTDWQVEVKNSRGFKGTDSIVHPLISLCWQCRRLKKLVVHGYWIWQYDLLGMARLRTNTIKHIEVSATYKFTPMEGIVDNDAILPIIYGQREQHADSIFIQQMNEFLPFRWAPVTNWSKLHPALLHTATEEDKQNYILQEIVQYPKYDCYIPKRLGSPPQ